MENYPVIDGVLTIPEGVKVINTSEFHQRLDVVKVVLPSSVTTISKAAFGNCENLESINIPESVNLIDDRAFGSCSSLWKSPVCVTPKAQVPLTLESKFRMTPIKS